MIKKKMLICAFATCESNLKIRFHRYILHSLNFFDQYVLYFLDEVHIAKMASGISLLGLNWKNLNMIS